MQTTGHEVRKYLQGTQRDGAGGEFDFSILGREEDGGRDLLEYSLKAYVCNVTVKPHNTAKRKTWG